MPQTASEILEAARQLPRHQRRWIGQELLDDEIENESPEDIEAAWGEEIKRRLVEIDSGAVQMIPAEEAIASMESLIASKRRG